MHYFYIYAWHVVYYPLHIIRVYNLQYKNFKHDYGILPSTEEPLMSQREVESLKPDYESASPIWKIWPHTGRTCYTAEHTSLSLGPSAPQTAGSTGSLRAPLLFGMKEQGNKVSTKDKRLDLQL